MALTATHLSFGSRGPQVEVFQRALNQYLKENNIRVPDVGSKLEVDAKYGWRTEAAVTAAQKFAKQNNKDFRVDGIIGPQTRQLLAKYTANAPVAPSTPTPTEPSDRGSPASTRSLAAPPVVAPANAAAPPEQTPQGAIPTETTPSAPPLQTQPVSAEPTVATVPVKPVTTPPPAELLDPARVDFSDRPLTHTPIPGVEARRVKTVGVGPNGEILPKAPSVDESPSPPIAAPVLAVRQDHPAAIASEATPANLPTPSPAPRPTETAAPSTNWRQGINVAEVERKLLPQLGRLSDPQALHTALTSVNNWMKLHPGHTQQPYLMFNDLGQAGSRQRSWILNIASGTIERGPMKVAHGSGSNPNGDGIPTNFADVSGRHTSVAGLMIGNGAEPFTGHSRAFGPYNTTKIDWESGNTALNAGALRDGKYTHGAPYISANHTGASWGCPALPSSEIAVGLNGARPDPNRLGPAVDLLKHGFAFNYTPLISHTRLAAATANKLPPRRDQPPIAGSHRPRARDSAPVRTRPSGNTHPYRGRGRTPATTVRRVRHG